MKSRRILSLKTAVSSAAALVALLAAPSMAFASIYNIDPSTSKIGWTGTKKIGSSHSGHILAKEGKVEFNSKGEITGGEIVIDMKSISNEDLKSDPANQKKLVGHLSSADFFNVNQHPTAVFKIKSVRSIEKGKALVKGDLTMIGNTQPAEFTLNWKEEKGIATGSGKLVVDRTKWGLKYGSGNFFKELTADKIINDQIELDLNITAKK